MRCVYRPAEFRVIEQIVLSENNPCYRPVPMNSEKNGVSEPSFTKRILFRHWIQLFVFVITLAIGLQFYLFVMQASGTGSVTIPRPAGVEGFLPIGALMSWKRFLLTAKWDTVHPAAMVILGFAMAVSLLFHKAFCSWFCPVGTLSEWLWRMGRKISGVRFQLPRWLDVALRAIKYLLLGLFLWVIFTMSVEAIRMFIHSPYYKISDVKMLHFITRMSLTTGIVLAVLTVGSLFIPNFWCRYFCPYGALTGLLGMIGPTRIKRNTDSCIECGKCSQVCPHRIDVKVKTIVYSPECSACMDCCESCPVDNTLSLQTGFVAGKAGWSSKRMGVVVVAIFGLVYALSALTGHWQTQLPENEFRELLKVIDSPLISHPRTTF